MITFRNELDRNIKIYWVGGMLESVLKQCCPGSQSLVMQRCVFCVFCVCDAASSCSVVTCITCPPCMQINYTGDAELYAHVPPAGWFTVDTFESHPWCAPPRPPACFPPPVAQ